MPDYQQVEQVALNKGINLRDEPDSLDEGQHRRLTNVTSTSEGALSTRPGRRWVAGANDGNEVHTLTKLGKYIISGSGQRLYRSGSAYPTTFSGNAISYVLHTASDGDERWMYLTDGTQFRMVAEDGSDIKWGITAPAVKVVATQTNETGTLNSGVPGAVVYDWRAVYKNSRTGAKSNPSPVITGISVVNKKAKIVAVSSLDGQVDSVEFYRRGGLNGLSTWRLVGASPNKGLDPVTNTPLPVEFIDNIPDATAVTGAELRIDNDVPFTTVDKVGNTVREAPFAYIWGPLDGKYIFACGDPNRPGHVYWTNPGRPHGASPANHVVVSPPDEPLIGGFVYGGLSYAWTRQNLYALDFQGDDAIVKFVPRRTFCGRGLSLPHAFAVGPMVWFFSKDGIYITDGQSPAEPFTETNLRPLFNPQVEDRQYVAPGALGEIAWPPYTIEAPRRETLGTIPDTPEEDFSVSANPTTLSGGVGTIKTIDVVVIPGEAGFWDSVILDIQGSLPQGTTYSFSRAWGVPGTDSFLSVLSLTLPQQPGSFVFQVRGQRGSGGLTRLSQPITVTVTGTAPPPPTPTPTEPTFTVVFSPNSVAIPRQQRRTVELRFTATGTLTAPISLTVAAPPTGVTVSLSSPTITPPSDPVVVTLDVNNLASLGATTIQVTGTSGAVTRTATLVLEVLAGVGSPVPAERRRSVLRLTYGGQELHVHYVDVLGQWVHLRNHLPYNRWRNDESPEVPGYGSIYESLSFFDEQQANTTLLIGTGLGLVALETGTFDYIQSQKIQCRVRTGSLHLGAPRTLKEFGNIIIEADCGDAVLPAAVNAAQPSGIAVTPYLNAETEVLSGQRIAGTGRQRFPRAVSTSNRGEQVYAYSLGLDFKWNGNATLYGWTIQFHPDEEYITHWNFGPTTHGLRGWQHVRDIYLTIANPFGTVTPTVVIDGVSYSMADDSGATTIAASPRKQKVHLWLPAVKGKVYQWQLAGIRFRLYGNECEIRAKEFSSGLGYQVLSPFAGGTAEV